MTREIKLFENDKWNRYGLVPIEELQLTKPKIPLRVALVIGHYNLDQGVTSKYPFNVGGKAGCRTEWNLYSEYQLHCKHEGNLDFYYEFFRHPDANGYENRQKATAALTKDFDLVIELHFNSNSDQTAHGSMALFNELNARTENLAKEFVSLMYEKGFRARSNKPISFHDDKMENGEGFLRLTKPDAILVEPLFGSNKEDCARFTFEILDYALNGMALYYAEVLKKK